MQNEKEEYDDEEETKGDDYFQDIEEIKEDTEQQTIEQQTTEQSSQERPKDVPVKSGNFLNNPEE